MGCFDLVWGLFLNHCWVTGSKQPILATLVLGKITHCVDVCDPSLVHFKSSNFLYAQTEEMHLNPFETVIWKKQKWHNFHITNKK